MEEKIINAFEKTFENAISLFEEAEILESKNKKNRAYTLYHFTIEESGRFYLLFKFLLSYYNGIIKPKNFNYGNLKKKGYSDHKIKLSTCVEGYYYMKLIETYLRKDKVDINFEEFKNNNKTKIIIESFLCDRNLIVQLDDLKNSSLYITYKNNEFLSPFEVINDKNFNLIKNLAQKSMEVMCEITKIIIDKGGFFNLKDEIKNVNKK